MPEYELKEIRSGHFAKIVGGEVVGMASKGEVATYFRQRYRASVDPGIIEVSLALSALFAVLFAQSWPTVFKIIAGLCFLLSFLTSLIFYISYMVQRIPITWDRFFSSRFAGFLRMHRFPGSLWIWMLWFYPTQLIRVILYPRRLPFDEQITEIGYLTLMATLTLGGLLVILYVIFGSFEF